MIDEPRICMLPSELPQQRLHEVVGLPERPGGFRGYCDWLNPMPEKDRPRGSPRRVDFVGSVEWAWGFRNDRWDAYYLNPRGKYWLLWIRYMDDNEWTPVWKWSLYAWGRRKKVRQREAAVYLLQDAWEAEQRESRIGPFLCINDCEFLSIAELCAIAHRVWPDGGFDDNVAD